jgi:hypothetical protein
MFRKITLALAATAAIGAAALAPTSASAHWHGHWHHGWHGGYGYGFGLGIYAPTYVAAPDCYIVRRVVHTPYGKRIRRVEVCG